MYLKRLYSVYCSTQCTMLHYVHITKISFHAAVVANRSITASVLGVSHRGFIAS